MVKPARGFQTSKRTGEDTLLLSQLGLTHKGQETRVCRPDLHKETACLGEAELTVHRQPNLGRVAFFLPVVFPPANRAQAHGVWRFERPVSATRTAEWSFQLVHCGVDEKSREGDYTRHLCNQEKA